MFPRGFTLLNPRSLKGFWYFEGDLRYDDRKIVNVDRLIKLSESKCTREEEGRRGEGAGKRIRRRKRRRREMMKLHSID